MAQALAQTWWLARNRAGEAVALNPWEALADRQLVAQTLGGRPDAYGELVRRYQATVYNVAYRLVGERQEALDVAQDAFVRGYHALRTFDQERPFGPWIGRIATNVALVSLQRRRVPTIPLGRIVGAGGEERAADVVPPDPARGPEENFLAAERDAELRRAILALPPRYRAVIELRHFQDLSYEEIAAALGLPLSDVKSHLFRARKLLREALGEAANRRTGERANGRQ
jgi:RNA polymerase sigma-70 factor (ECF subfamily)